jgi:glycosyltransferase involved in cell wall biosynthesis
LRVVLAMECTIGGTRRHIVDLCAGLAARGVDAHLVASTLRQPDFDADLGQLESLGVRATRLPMVREPSPAADLRHLRALARILERERPHVLHTHSSKAGALGRLAALLAGHAAVVHTPHTFAFLFDAMFPARKRRLYFEIERALSGCTRRIVAVGESEADTIRRSGVCDPDRVRVVRNGIDLAAHATALPIGRAELGVPADAPLLLVAGLFNEAKGQDLALRALASPAGRGAHLLLAGHGASEPALRALARALGIESRVRFLGWRTDLPRLVRTCDWLVLPSRWEALPYVVLEALVAGTPVVATPVDGAREILSESGAGELARSCEAPALAEALGRALARTPAEREWMGERGRAHVVARHSRDSMVDGTLAVYEEAMA